MIRVYENMHNLFDKLPAPNLKWKDWYYKLEQEIKTFGRPSIALK